jgi:SAM-dependent methyltransferase
VAVDPTPAFVAAVADRYPGVDVRRAVAEDLPFEDDAFDVVGAQLVVHFMSDAVAGVREMRRVARPGGRVGACVWDHRDRGPLTTFWRAAREVGSGVAGEDSLAGVRRGHLAELFTQAGVRHIEESELTVARTFGTFEDWWEPFTLGVGPAGEHVAGLDARGRDALRTRCADVLGEPPFTVGATAWCVLGHA